MSADISQKVGLGVRIATVADAGTIADIHANGWRENYVGMVPAALLDAVEPRIDRWEQALATPAAGQGAFVAEIGGAIIGVCTHGLQRSDSLLRQGFAGEIWSIYVNRSAQRLGAGRALFVASARALIGQGHPGLALWTLENNQPARNFYGRLGGRIVDGRKARRGAFVLDEIAFGWSSDDLARLVRPAIKY